MPKIILGFTGPIASGKDVSQKYLSKKYGAVGFRFSTIMRDILQRLDLEINRLNLSRLSSVLRETFSEDLFAKVIANDVLNSPAELIIVDGIRRPADIQYLRDIPNFYLISIDADPQIRYERLIKRKENIGDENKTYDQFLADHLLESELSIPTIMAKANYQINNNQPLSDLYQQLDDIIVTIKQQKYA